jgi:hypothetical protein
MFARLQFNPLNLKDRLTRPYFALTGGDKNRPLRKTLNSSQFAANAIDELIVVYFLLT